MLDELRDVQSSTSSYEKISGDDEVELNYGVAENNSKRIKNKAHRQTSDEFNAHLSNNGDEHKEYSVNRLNFDTIEREIEELRKEHQILDDIILRLLRKMR